MKKRLLMMLLTVGLLAAMLPGVAVAGDGPNQGRSDFITTVEVEWGCCEAVPGPKQEGDFGKFEVIWSYAPIDFITVKSGRDADFWVVWSAEKYGKYFVAIKGTKDISNYVVWTCPCVSSGTA